MGFGYNECTNISDDPSKSVHLMIRYRSQKQLTLAGFSSPFRTALDPENRWVKLAQLIPWDDLARAYHKSLLSSTQGRPAKDAAGSDPSFPSAPRGRSGSRSCANRW